MGALSARLRGSQLLWMYSVSPDCSEKSLLAHAKLGTSIVPDTTTLEEQLAAAPGAILCEPDAASLLAGLRRLLAMPAACIALPPAKTQEAWHEVAASLMRQIEALRLA